MPIEENERGTYIFNSKDLCMIEHIPELAAAGIDSFKIEGRMKTALYVAVVARTYRQAVDDYFEDPGKYSEKLPYYREEIAKCTYRQFTTGFFFGPTDHETQIYDNNTYVRGYTFLGRVDEVTGDGLAVFRQKNKFCAGDEIELMMPEGENITATVERMYNEYGEVDSCPHPGERIWIRLSRPVHAGVILRQQAGGGDE